MICAICWNTWKMRQYAKYVAIAYLHKTDMPKIFSQDETCTSAAIDMQKCATIIIMPSVLWHCWFDIKKSIRLAKLEWWVLVWLSVWSEVQIVCIWFSWCHCHPKTSSSLAPLKSRLVLPFWYWLTQAVLEKKPLNRCSSSVVCEYYCHTDPVKSCADMQWRVMWSSLRIDICSIEQQVLQLLWQAILTRLHQQQNTELILSPYINLLQNSVRKTVQK